MHLFHTPFHYFSYNPNQEVREVYWHSAINSLALSLVFIFEPIYLYSLGYSLTKILWFYVLVYCFYVAFIFLGAKFASHFGYKHSIFISNIFYVIYWVLLFSVESFPSLFYVAPVFFALQKSWFWPAYNADIALASVKVQRGREVGVLFSLIQAVFIAGPFLGGLISHHLGFMVLFITSAVLMLCSVYPLLRSPEIYSRHSFKFRNFFKVLKNYPRNFFGYWGYAEDLMVMSLWPVLIYITVPNFVNVGTIATIATIVGTVLMLYIGKVTDRADKPRLIRITSIFYSLSWIFRFLAQGVFGILVFDTWTKTGKDALNVPMVALTFERAGSRESDYAIAYSVFYEFSLSVGKIFTALLGILILSSGASVFWVFAVVGILTLFYGLLK